VTTSTEEKNVEKIIGEPTDEEQQVNDQQSQSERDRLMSQAYGAAQKDLREKYKDEFNRYYQKRCAERGIEWTPRKSKAEQALDQITDLLSEYPDIAEQVAERLAAQLEGADEQQGEGE
jgi:hypothetical protein